MAFCLTLSSLKSLLYSSAAISCLLAALSNLVCKLVVVVVDTKRLLALSCKSSWDTSVSNSLPFANACALACSVVGAI